MMRVPLFVSYTLGAVLCGVIAGFQSPVVAAPKQLRESDARVLAGMRNSDVEWQGSYFGLWPEIADERIRHLSQARGPIDEALLCALTDPGKVVVAHVLLVMRHAVKLQAHLEAGDAAEQWYGLRVQLYDERSEYEGNDYVELYRKWVTALKADGLTCQ